MEVDTLISPVYLLRVVLEYSGVFWAWLPTIKRLIVVHTAKLQQWEARLQGVLGGLSTESAGTR